jgi:hypothetical protein
MARSLALGAQEALGRAQTDAAAAAQSGIMLGGLGSGIALALVSLLVLGALQKKVPPAGFALILVLLIGADLWRAGRDFWHWSRPEQELFKPDAIIERVKQAPAPYRILDLGQFYPEGGWSHALMRHEVQQVLGTSAVELRFYDELLGGRNVWNNLRYPNLWRLLAVRFVLAADTIHLPGYHRIQGPTPTSGGRPAYLYEADTVPPYARVIPAAVKGDTDRIVPTLIDPRLDYNRLMLFLPNEPINPLPVTAMPEPSPAQARITSWQPGRMTVSLDPAPPSASYLLVAENWYPDWHAKVDGAEAQVLRGDYAFLSVPIAAGARTVELQFDSADYRHGRLVTLISLLVLGAWGGGAIVRRRGRGRGRASSA